MTEEIKTWTIFKNTNNTLEGIESITFAMWQVALDEIEKESDHIVFMSDATAKLIISNKKRLEQENRELKELNKKICEDWEKVIKVYWNVLEEIKVISDNYNLTVNKRRKQIADKINGVLNE